MKLAYTPLAELLDEKRRLGRHIAHDRRSREFPADVAAKIVSVKHEAHGLPLDQGNVGSCTAEALIGALNSAPDYDGKTYTQQDAGALYTVEGKLEGYNVPPDDPGGTGLYVCRAAKQTGLIRAYHHAFGLRHALRALVLRPVITGINWYDSFDRPDRDGLVAISAQARVRGGHEIVADEIDAPNGLVWFWNSWGSSWGIGGRFCMSFDTWGRLLGELGDVTVPYV